MLASEGADAQGLVRATEVWPSQGSARVEALAYAYCESRGQVTSRNGVHAGAWNVSEDFWGPVPSTVDEQAVQVYEIWSQYAWTPWDYCPLIQFIASRSDPA